MISAKTSKMRDCNKLILAVNVGIKDMNPQKSIQYLIEIRDHMERTFDDTVKILVFPDRDSKKVVVQQITKVKGMSADELESLIQRSVDVLEKIR
jgi:hypothetical protein